MDLNSLKTAVAGLSLYDVKAGVRKVQNGTLCATPSCCYLVSLLMIFFFLAVAVMNYTEMEAKVREATNNEPWGASSTQMQEIADGTFN